MNFREKTAGLALTPERNAAHHPRKKHRTEPSSTNVLQPCRGLGHLLRAALLLLATIVLLLPASRPQAVRAQGSSGEVDITATKPQFNWTFPDRDTGNATTVNTGALLDLSLPQQDQSALGPLVLLPLQSVGSTFDYLWSTPTQKNQPSMEARSCQMAQNDLTSNVSGSYQAQNITCAFAGSGGTVDGEVETQWPGPENPQTLQLTTIKGSRLMLDYLIPNNSLSFEITTAVTGGGSPLSNPRFTATFNIGLSLYFVVSDSTCSLTPTAIGAVSNLTINPDNAEAQLAMDDPDVQSLIGSVTSVMNGAPIPLDAGASSGLLGPLSQVWQAACDLGFSQASATVDPTIGLSLTFTHPPYDAPETFNQVGNLIGATIEPAQSDQVKAGSPIAISGQGFTYAGSDQTTNATSVTFTWQDSAPVSQITESDVKWGPQGGQTSTETLQRKSNDNHNSYQANGLTPNSDYTFQVRDCDPVTCSPWSASRTMTTGTQGSNAVRFWLDNDSGTQIGLATVQPDGTITAGVNIPGAATAGQHTLNAQINVPGGQQTSTTIMVLATGQSIQPEIVLVNPATGNWEQSGAATVAGSPFTLHGEGFDAGQTITIYLDKAAGQVIGTAQMAKIGTTFETQFTMPTPQQGGYGRHTLVAVEGGAGQNQATLSIFVEAPAQ